MTPDEEIEKGDRFKFGENWQGFLRVLTDERICAAEKSICDFMGKRTLEGLSFLDIGSGSGLSSLVARRLGARVHSFDFDPQSVECTTELKRRYFRDDPCWEIEQGSVLDRGFVESLGTYDVCYAWGVLHHTDSMWQALYNAHLAVAEDGLLFIAIYNDEGLASALWERVKKTYCAGGLARGMMVGLFYPLFFFAGLAADIVRARNPMKRYKEHKKLRGMSLLHDWKDWLGGFPYERASAKRIIAFFENLGYELLKSEAPVYGFGNNQFLFRKKPAAR